MTSPVTADNTSLKSTFYEQLVEHVFIAEVLQEIWYSFEVTAAVLRSEVDASGYDLVIECNGVLRHIQLKTSKHNAKRDAQNVNVALAEKPGGCVIWLFRQENPDSRRMSLSYRFFGGDSGKPLPPLTTFKIAKGRGENIREVPKSRFVSIPTTRGLVERLFGLRPDGPPAKPTAASGKEADREQQTAAETR